MEELLLILEAARKKDWESKKFMAQLQGVDLESDSEVEDVANLKGVHASQAGFGIGMGLGYSLIEGE